MTDIPAPGTLWLHKARRTSYEVLDTCEIQVSREAVVDGSELVLYRGTDGKLWARHVDEFTDGRFVQILEDPRS